MSTSLRLEEEKLPTPPSVVIETIPPIPLTSSLPLCSSIVQRRYIQYSTTEHHITSNHNLMEIDIDSLTLMEQIVLLGLNDKQVRASRLMI